MLLEKYSINNGISSETLIDLENEITQGNCQILFFDWDECFQKLNSPYPFETMNPITQDRVLPTWLSQDKLDSYDNTYKKIPITDDKTLSNLHIRHSSQHHPVKVDTYMREKHQKQHQQHQQLFEVRQAAHAKYLESHSSDT